MEPKASAAKETEVVPEKKVEQPQAVKVVPQADSDKKVREKTPRGQVVKTNKNKHSTAPKDAVSNA